MFALWRRSSLRLLLAVGVLSERGLNYRLERHALLGGQHLEPLVQLGVIS